MEYKVPKDRILICRIMIFDDYNPKTGGFVVRKLSADDELRPVIFMDGDVIDFATGDVIKPLKRDEDGFIVGEVNTNTMYYDVIYKAKIDVVNENEDNDLELPEGVQELPEDTPAVSDNHELFEAADNLYEYYLMRKKLTQENKVVEFKQKRLY